jgi:hypothetical protein
VLAGVRQALLDDPVRRAPGRRRDRGGVDVHLGADAHTRRARLGDERGQVGERRLRAGGGRGVLVAEHPDHAAQVVERVVRAGADDRGGAGDLVGCGRGALRAELERPRVQRDEREAVGEDVVHLARDAGALVVARLLDAQLLLGLGALGPLAEREDELAAGPDVHPPRDDARRDDRREDRLDERRDGRVGVQQDVRRDDRGVQGGDGDDDAQRAVDRHGEQRDGTGDPGAGDEGAEQPERDGEVDGPAPAPRERGARGQPDEQVGRRRQDEAGSRLARDALGEQQRAAHHRDDDAGRVDEQPAPAPGRPAGRGAGVAGLAAGRRSGGDRHRHRRGLEGGAAHRRGAYARPAPVSTDRSRRPAPTFVARASPGDGLRRDRPPATLAR